MKEQRSILEFENYYIESFVFEKNEEFNISKEEQVKLNIDFDFDTKYEGDLFIRKVTCTIFDEDYIKNNNPFYLELLMNGVFRFPGFDKENDMHTEIIKKNTLAILFPYIRSTISHMTMEMQIQPVKLPPMNIKSFFEEKNE